MGLWVRGPSELRVLWAPDKAPGQPQVVGLVSWQFGFPQGGFASFLAAADRSKAPLVLPG